MFTGEITERYELEELPMQFLCRRVLVRRRPGCTEIASDRETLLQCFGGVLNCRIEKHSEGFVAVVYIAD